MRSGRRGFTLAEIAAAVAILAVLLAVVYAGYGLGVRSWKRGEEIHAAVSELRLAGSFVRDRVEQAYPLLAVAGSGRRIRFNGEPQRLSFVTWLPGYLGEGGLYEVVFAMDARESGSDLSMSRWRLSDTLRGRSNRDRQRRLLVRDLSKVQFDYFGSTVDGVPPGWHSRWHARERLPLLVRLRMTSRQVGEWPAIVIPVHSESPTQMHAALPPASVNGGVASLALQSRLRDVR